MIDIQYQRHLLNIVFSALNLLISLPCAPALLQMKNIDDNGQEASSTTSHAQSLVTIYHRPYQSSDIPKPGDPPGSTLNWYDPYVRHYVMNVYQNCYNPAARLDQGIKRMATPPNSNYCNNVEQGGEYCNFIKTP